MTPGEQQLDDILQGRFIRRVLTEAVSDINLAQVKYIQSQGFSNPDWISERDFAVSESALEYAQLFKHRFVDMRHMTLGDERRKKKYHPLYNRIMYGHYNNIIRQLSFGFTEAVKEELRQLEE